MKKLLIILFVLILILATSFYFVVIDREPTHEIGRVQVKGIPQLYFDLEQDNDFDMVTGISYGISTETNEIIAPKKALIGTHDYITSPENFHANSVDSIIYLTWGDTTEIYAVYDLRTGHGYPSRMGNYKNSSQVADSLTDLLNKSRPYLTANWEK